MLGDDKAGATSERQSNTPPPTPEQWDEVFNGFGPRRRVFNEALSRSLEWTLENIRAHWLFILNGTVVAFASVALLAPIGYALGFSGPASAIFSAYHFVCAQTPSHSFFIFGYQTCLCSRCLAIYCSLLLAGVALAFVRKQRLVRGIPWYVWVLAMAPMALDGFSQLFGVRESNLVLRLFTGSVFGVATAWFLLPQLERAASLDPEPSIPQSFVATHPATMQGDDQSHTR